MSTYDMTQKRPLEVALKFHDDAGVSMRDALDNMHTACDALFTVQVMRGADGAPDKFVTSSYDGRTRATLTTPELFDIWIALAGHLARSNPDDGDDKQAVVNKRFVLTVLAQLRLSAELGRLPVDAARPEMPIGADSGVLGTLASVEDAEGDGTEMVEGAETLQRMRAEFKRLAPAFEAEMAKRPPTPPPAARSAPGFDVIEPEALEAPTDPTSAS